MSNVKKLYVLRKVNTKEVYAISEFELNMMNYIKLFDTYFGGEGKIDKSKYQLDIVTNQSDIQWYLNRYIDYHLQSLADDSDLVLTDWEWNFYNPVFRELHEKAKDTIIYLKMFSTIYSKGEFQPNTYKLMTDMENVCQEFYEVASNFDVFVKNIPSEYLRQYILIEPIKAHMFNQLEKELREQYYQKFNDNK